MHQCQMQVMGIKKKTFTRIFFATAFSQELYLSNFHTQTIHKIFVKTQVQIKIKKYL